MNQSINIILDLDGVQGKERRISCVYPLQCYYLPFLNMFCSCQLFIFLLQEHYFRTSYSRERKSAWW